MESMKVDLATLVKQLNDNEEKYKQLAKYHGLLQNEMHEKVKTIPTTSQGNGNILTLDNLEHDVTPLIKIRELKRKNLELHKMVSSRDEKVL